MKAGGTAVLQRMERNTRKTNYLTIQLMLFFCSKHNKVGVAVCKDVECLSEESMICERIWNRGILINPLTAICKKSKSNSERGIHNLLSV